MRFASLGSGSSGNATLIAAGDQQLLLDCGFSVKETCRRLAELNLSAEMLTGIVVTHEHADHGGGVAALARRYDLPVWATHGTARSLRDNHIPTLNPIDSHTPFRIGDLHITPFPVPHDASEPCQFVFGTGPARLGVLTDAGGVTPHIVAQLSGCNTLILECNHDTGMLRDGPYPPALRARVGGPFGHLANSQAAELLRRIDGRNLQRLVLAHLSENNNTPELALTAVCEALQCDREWPQVLRQGSVSGWYEVSGELR